MQYKVCQLHSQEEKQNRVNQTQDLLKHEQYIKTAKASKKPKHNQPVSVRLRQRRRNCTGCASSLALGHFIICVSLYIL